MTELTLYNTLTRKKEAFAPIDPGRVRMYVCGPTVYDHAHIGNARPVIVFDVLYRLLRHLYGGDNVTYVRNITDVDDKINARALERFGADIDAGRMSVNEAISKVTEGTTRQFHKDVKALGCLEPTVEPRATGHIPGMIAMIQRLLDEGCAYLATGSEGAEVLFDVTSMPDYGALSRRKLEEQQAGARVAVEAHKKNPADFVLWKQSGADVPGWDATFTSNGTSASIHGRPGWHIECSVMSEAHLGEVFDIHGGGLDLIFPHHENEIAQSRCAHGTPVMANVWMHNGFLQVEGKKMAKSEGNFVTIHELLHTEKFGGRKWPGEVLRLAMLMTHYREPIDFSVSRLEEAETVLNGWYRSVGDTALCADEVKKDVLIALLDDLNTTEAIARLQSLRAAASSGSSECKSILKASASLLGLLQKTESEWNQSKLEARTHHLQAGDVESRSEVSRPRLTEIESEIESQIGHRLALLRDKNYAEADRIRAELAEQGIQLMDYKDAETGERRTRWEVKR